jgi:hypothetical protein
MTGRQRLSSVVYAPGKEQTKRLMRESFGLIFLTRCGTIVIQYFLHGLEILRGRFL